MSDTELGRRVDLRELRYVLYETKGGLGVLSQTEGEALRLVSAGLAAATGQGGLEPR